MKSSRLPGSAAQALRLDVAPAIRPFGLSRLASLWTLYVLTLRQHLHGKRWMVMGGMFLLCAGLVILVRTTSPDVPVLTLEFVFAFLFIPQAILPLLALVYASGIVRDEQEEQTMTYLLIRPIPKWALYTVKLLAMLTTTVVLTTALTALLYAAIYVGADTEGKNVPLRCLQAASIHALAVVAYCCLFGLISLFTKRALIVGVLYALVFEGLLANMPFSIRLATVIYYTRLIAYRTLSFVISVPLGTPANRGQETHDIAAEFWQFDVKRDPGLREHPQIQACVTVLLVASLVCTVVAAFVFSVREFHVKTPEKD
jgi:ABC-2 type transport system permease protein